MATLADLEEGDSTEIDRVFEEDEQLLRFFYEEDIRPGQRVLLQNVAPYRGTVTVRIGEERQVVMGTQVARLIWVKAPAAEGRQGQQRPRTSQSASR